MTIVDYFIYNYYYYYIIIIIIIIVKIRPEKMMTFLISFTLSFE